MRIAPLIRVAATLLGCLSSGAVAQRAGAAVSGAATCRAEAHAACLSVSLGEALNVVLSSTGLKCGARRLQGGNRRPPIAWSARFPRQSKYPRIRDGLHRLFVLPHASPQIPLNPNVVGDRSRTQLRSSSGPS